MTDPVTPEEHVPTERSDALRDSTASRECDREGCDGSAPPGDARGASRSRMRRSSDGAGDDLRRRASPGRTSPEDVERRGPMQRGPRFYWIRSSHAKVVTLVHTILNVIDRLTSYTLTAEIAHAHRAALLTRDMRTHRLLRCRAADIDWALRECQLTACAIDCSTGRWGNRSPYPPRHPEMNEPPW